ncbi:jigr1, partial [Drosophila busckii]
MAQQQAQLGHVSLPTHPQPPQHVPKGRGRPRASYAQTGEFDLGLIREFRGRPALYDRANKRFKDKMHGAQLWMQISHKLGYDVSLLRERMITLRNRYNIEKRRVENSGIAISQWPLYDNLSFLSEHIRSRRTYKPQSREGDDDEEPYDVDNESQSNGHMKSIKHEFDPDFDEDDMDCDQPLPVTTLLTIPRNLDMANHQHNCNGSELVNGKSHPTSMLSTSLGCRQPELLVAKQK